MQLDGRLRAIVDKLPLTLESERFIIRFGLRNQMCGKGLGYGGIRDYAIVYCYLDALERLYSAMTRPPFNRKPPMVGGEGKTVVYVFEILDLGPGYNSPFMSFDRQYIPFIALPCRSSEPTTYAEYQRAAAEAIHEATHVFNYQSRPIHDLTSEPWAWFDEAIAVFMETLVMSGNPDYLRFVMNWIDMPYIPLDDWSARYRARMFVCYLSKRMKFRFINKVWTESYKIETPFEALSRLLPRRLKLSSSNPKHRDIFASGYCMDSYFLIDHGSLGFAPEIYERYGERAIEESFVLGAGDKAKNECYLDHLSCRYYRFYLKTGVAKLQVQLQTPGTYSNTPLKAELATVTKEMRKGIVKPLSTKSSPGPGGSVQLFAELTGIDWKNIDHVVLVVSNCGLRAAKINPDIEHDDGQEYTIEASAL